MGRKHTHTHTHTPFKEKNGNGTKILGKSDMSKKKEKRKKHVCGCRAVESAKEALQHNKNKTNKKRTHKEPNARLRRLSAATKPRLCAQLILDRAAPTMIRSLESGQGTGVLQETSTQVVSSVAKMYVGDLIEEGTVLQVKCSY